MADPAVSRRPRALTAVLLTVTIFGPAACSASIPTSQVFGPNVAVITVLTDPPAVPGVRCAMARYALGKARGMRLGVGAPAAIAAAVKDGQPADLVILPAGPALNHVRDELATPPTQVVLPGEKTEWVGAVTDKGLAAARFLTTRQGRTLLSPSHCSAAVSGHTG